MTKTVMVKLEMWVTHRDDLTPWNGLDKPGYDWRACVKNSDGSLTWQWCKTFDDATEWCQKFVN